MCMEAIQVPKAQAAGSKGTVDWLINLYLYLSLYLYQSLSNASIYICTHVFIWAELRLCRTGHG